MNSGIPVFFNQSLGDKNGILEVIAVPGHECHQQVLPQGQFPHVRRRPVGENISFSYCISGLHQRPLVDTGILVRSGIFNKIIDIDTGFSRDNFIVIDTYHDTAGID